MSDDLTYLYDNEQPDAKTRLMGLEAIEDDNTVSLLRKLTNLDGCVCLEIGAGAGSIAEWLAREVGSSGTVTATDMEPMHLSGSGFAVLRHDITKDELTTEHYDLVHMRHVLIHLADPLKALQNVFSSLKPGGIILAEESDLSTWGPEGRSSEAAKNVFWKGVNAIFSTYESRGMDIRIGTRLSALLVNSGFIVNGQYDYKRSVVGGSPEAIYQSKSANQLADAIGGGNGLAESIKRFSDCLLDPELSYQSRTTVSIFAERQV